MGLIGPYMYVNKEGKKFWLHMKKKGKVTLYFFSKDPTGAILNVPKGFEVIENTRTGMPFLKKGTGGGLLSSIFKRKKPKEEIKEEAPKEEAPKTEE